MQPSLESALQVLRPSIVRGTLIATLSAIFRRIAASFIIVSWSSATTSADTGPSTMPQLSSTTSTNLRPDLWLKVGLVVTPSSNPVAAGSVMSLISAVSTKNFMARPFNGGVIRCGRLSRHEGEGVRARLPQLNRLLGTGLFLFSIHPLTDRKSTRLNYVH